MPDLERALADLGRHLRYPPERDLAPAVATELRAAPSRARPAPIRVLPRRRVLALALAATLVVAGLLALVPGVRAAIIRLFTAPGVRIEVGGPQPSVPPLGARIFLGQQLSPTELATQVRFPIRVPSTLGEPDEVYLQRPPGIVWLVYKPRPGLPETPETGVGALVAEFRGRPEGEFILKKLPGLGVQVETVEVGDASGFWLVGPPHPLLLIDRDGEPIDEHTRLAGNTLIWFRGDITYRLESSLDRDAAIRLAETIR